MTNRKSLLGGDQKLLFFQESDLVGNILGGDDRVGLLVFFQRLADLAIFGQHLALVAEGLEFFDFRGEFFPEAGKGMGSFRADHVRLVGQRIENGLGIEDLVSLNLLGEAGESFPAGLHRVGKLQRHMDRRRRGTGAEGSHRTGECVEVRGKIRGKIITIYTITIFQEYQDLGYGKQVIERLQETFNTIVADRVRFSAIGFWEKMDFKERADGCFEYRRRT